MPNEPSPARFPPPSSLPTSLSFFCRVIYARPGYTAVGVARGRKRG